MYVGLCLCVCVVIGRSASLVRDVWREQGDMHRAAASLIEPEQNDM